MRNVRLEDELRAALNASAATHPSANPIGKYQYVSRIELEPTSERVSPPRVEQRSPNQEFFEEGFPGLRGTSLGFRDQETVITVPADRWTVSFHIDYVADFKKVAAVVGELQAAKVLDALKGQVPENWEELAKAADVNATPRLLNLTNRNDEPEETCCDTGACE